MTEGGGGRQFWLDKPGSVRTVLRTLYGICAGLMLLDFLAYTLRVLHLADLRHSYRAWEGLPGFYGAYGFIACVVLVLLATQMRKLVMRRDDFYDE